LEKENMPLKMNDDLELVHRAQGGDFAAFESLVARYERRLFGLALRIVRRQHDAEEVVQQTFLSVIENIGKFRGESLFSTWLTRIAMNHALLLLRREKRHKTLPLGSDGGEERYEDVPRPEFIAQWRETPDEIASRRESREILDEALSQLDEKYRLVFLLRDMEGLSVAETAAALDISPANVKVRLLRARLKLRELLTRRFGDEATRVMPHEH
jgi:RNA polymerase sigma-70 factor (ECF subfamily)